MSLSCVAACRDAPWLALCALSLATACTPEEPTSLPGHPDLTGVWMAFASVAPDGARGPQYSAEGEASIDAFYSQYTEVPELGAFCVPNGMPGVMLSTVSYPVEIVQTPTKLFMLAELEMQVRRVFLDGRGHSNDYLPTGVGHSVGHWEGEQLVIDTTLLQEWQGRPWPRGENTRVTERLYRMQRPDVPVQASGFVASLGPPLNDDVLVVDLTLTDPTLYAGAQRRIAYYQRVADTATLEYACSTELWFEELEKNRVSR